MFRIAVLPGDGIGREIVPEAVGVLQKIDKKYGLGLEFQYGLISEDAYAKYGHPLPQETIDLCKQSQAVLLGAVGSPQMDALPAELRPERAALLPIRKILGLFANLRLVTAYEPLLHASTLKPEVISGIDILVVRELTGGLYFGEKRREGAGPERGERPDQRRDLREQHHAPAVVPPQHQHADGAFELVQVSVELVHGAVDDAQEVLVVHRQGGCKGGVKPK